MAGRGLYGASDPAKGAAAKRLRPLLISNDLDALEKEVRAVLVDQMKQHVSTVASAFLSQHYKSTELMSNDWRTVNSANSYAIAQARLKALGQP